MALGVDAGYQMRTFRFSPLHEGDTSVAALETLADCCAIVCFSPLHEGDTSVARRRSVLVCRRSGFQSPSRGGHLRGAAADDSTEGPDLGFSPLHEGDTSVAAA